jgi:arylsulfatase
VYNLANLERTYLVGEPLPPGKHTIRYEFDYDGGSGFGHGGDGTLYVNDKKVAEAHIPRTMGIRISLDETFDVGADAGEPVSPDYHVPFDFQGKLNRVDVKLGD